MTTAMQKAIAEVGKLPVERQDQIANLMLAECATDDDWERTTLKYPDALQRLADEAIAALRRGETIDPEELCR